MPAGSRLGPYEILAPLGAGGMGEVCRARDGQTFVLVSGARGQTRKQVDLVMGWSGELARAAPAKK